MVTQHDLTDLLAPDAITNPYPVLATLRESSPVVWSEAQRGWLVLRFDDVVEMLQDGRLSSDRVMPIFDGRLSDEQRDERRPTYDLLRHWMVFNDPPNHTRLRLLVRHAFTPGAIKRLEERIESLVGRLLDELATRDHVDLISDFSYVIPATVIGEMMGVPDEDMETFKSWSDDVMTIVFGVAREPGVLDEAQRGLIELRDYLQDMVRAARGEAPADNLISELAHAKEQNDELTDEEIVSTCVLLLFGGNETTTNLIGNGARALMAHRDQHSWLLDNPGSLSQAVEELLRFDGPSKLEVRRCVAPIELRGQTIAIGDRVYLLQAAANRDPDAFPNPDRLDLQRTGSRHVGFGLGAHYCLGAPVARLEARIALGRLITRFPDMTPAREAPIWHPTLVSRGMASFPVSLHG
jgi:cytochrome P450